MPSYRPFRFTGLPRLTREQVAIQQSLGGYLSQRPFKDDFAPSLGSMLESYLKTPCQIASSELKAVAKNELTSLIPSTTCLLVIGAAPTEHKLIVDLDASIAAFCIDRLLGGSGDVSRIQ